MSQVPSRDRSPTVEQDRGPKLSVLERAKMRGREALAPLRRVYRLINYVAVSVIGIVATLLLIYLTFGPLSYAILGPLQSELQGKDLADALGGVRQAVMAAIAGIVATVGLLFTSLTYRASKRSHEVDRFAQAATLLGSDRQAERIGGLLTIEHIINERRPEARAGAELIIAYIAEHAASDSDELEESKRSPAPAWGDPSDELSRDLQIALHILGHGFPLPLRFMMDLSQTDLRGAGLAGSRFPGTKFFNCQLQGSSFVGGDLKSCRLDGSSFVGAWLERADLRWTTFRDVDLRGANLRKAKVDAHQLLPAIIDGSTILDADVAAKLDELREIRSES
jgi:hypothetical protein